MKKTLFAAASLLAFSAAHADPQATTIILNSASPMTQGIALVLANQMQGQGQGPGGVPQYGQNGRDPLGRRQQNAGPDFGDQVKVPDEIDTQRAREILEEIRRRLGTNSSPELEKRYLERLLDIR